MLLDSEEERLDGEGRVKRGHGRTMRKAVGGAGEMMRNKNREKKKWAKTEEKVYLYHSSKFCFFLLIF